MQRLRYYDSLVFKIFYGNEPLARGGLYSIGDVNASGFVSMWIVVSIEKIDKVQMNRSNLGCWITVGR